MQEEVEYRHTVQVQKRKKFWKFWILMFLINLGFLTVLVKLVFIQVINAESYKNRAKRQHESRIEINAERGSIYDRNNNLLAGNINSISIAADPSLIENIDSLASLLSDYTNRSPEYYKDKINSADSRFVWLERGMKNFNSANLKALEDKGIIILQEPQRILTYDYIGTQIIGMTDTENNGLSAVELLWNQNLVGQNGYMIMNRDALGNLMPSADLPLIEAKDGNSLVLTIDIDLQRIMEYELEQGVLRNNASSGTAIAMNPNTGEILAMASYPGFNKSNIRSTPLSNRKIKAITDPYEPGSTFKIFTAAAAFEENLLNEDDYFDDYTHTVRAGRGFIKDIHNLKVPTFRNAIIHSSNVIFSKAADLIPDYKFYKYLRDFGFGNKLDIDLPGEVSGRLPKPEEFSGISKRYLGQGYELLVTPLQLISAYSAIANGGNLMKPYIVSSIIDNQNKTIKNYKPQLIRKVVSEETTKRLTDVLIEAVEKGTGKNAYIKGINIAGKTGTSQQVVGGTYSKSAYNASFVGYFPAENPEIVMLVLIDRPIGNYYGGYVAAPIFKSIVTRMLYSQKYRNLHNTLVLSDSLEINRNILIPDFRGMDFSFAERYLKNFEIKIISEQKSGIILGQEPQPGINNYDLSGINFNTYTEKFYSVEEESKANEFVLDEIKGLSSKAALNILHLNGYKAKIIGTGKVRDIGIFTESSGEKYVRLICK